MRTSRGFRVMFSAGLLLVLVYSIAYALVTLNPADDSYVRLTSPNTNFDGNRLIIQATCSPSFQPSDIAYLRFDLSGLSGDLNAGTFSARLRLYNQFPQSGSVVAVYSTTDDDWNGADAGNGDETTLTYNKRPSEGSELASLTVSSSSAHWMEFTGSALSTYVFNQYPGNGGDGLVTFLVRFKSCSTGGNLSEANVFEDRENTGGSGNEPELRMEDTTLVNLSSFTATGYADHVLVEWETTSEISGYGFNLWRSEAQDGLYSRLNPDLIPAQGGPTFGASYAYDDVEVTKGVTYWYKLENVDVHGQGTFYGPVWAAIDSTYRLYLPLVSR